jgi:hypothetical protein
MVGVRNPLPWKNTPQSYPSHSSGKIIEDKNRTYFITFLIHGVGRVKKAPTKFNSIMVPTLQKYFEGRLCSYRYHT